MRLIGFSFQKISIERNQRQPENIKFNTKIDVTSIEPAKSDVLKTREELLNINFVYSILYEPDFAKIELAGNILLSVEPKIAREVVKGWKNKETSEEFRIILFNLILKKSNIKALQLEDELNLPPHIPLPTITKEGLKEKKQDS